MCSTRRSPKSGAIALFHTGQTGVGSGMPGGGGIRLKYSNPMYIDDVAVDFPDMQIILAHPSFPWQEEALAVAQHKPNVYIDLSGWSPKYFPPILVHYANTLLRKKMLFGSDYPVLTPDRWMADFEKIDIRPEVRPLILKDNAAQLLGLQEMRSGHDMRRSSEKILTTHIGSLPDFVVLDPNAPDHEAQAAAPSSPSAVKKQRDTGLDIINEGEFAKHGDWLRYAESRLGGCEPRKVASTVFTEGKDREEFAGVLQIRHRTRHAVLSAERRT